MMRACSETSEYTKYREVEKLKAEAIVCDVARHLGVAEGMERAAKIVEGYNINPEIIRPRPAGLILGGIAAAIRAEAKKKQ